MVGVLILHPKRNSSSDSPNKACVVHVKLPIAITWRGVDKLTSETFFSFSKKKRKEVRLFIILISPRSTVYILDADSTHTHNRDSSNLVQYPIFRVYNLRHLNL